MIHRVGLVLGVALAACNGGAGEQEYLSSDVRIDAAGPTDGSDAWGTRMCVTPSGHVFVVWTDDREGKSSVWLNRSTDAGRSWWTGAKRIDHGAGQAENPDIACTDEVVYVVWEDDRDGELENHNIYVNYSVDQGTKWLDSDVALDADPDGYAMSLGPEVVASGDRVAVAWYDAVSGAYDIYTVASLDRGESWSDPVRVDSDDAGSAYSATPQLAMDGAGHVYLAWEDSRGGLSDVYFAVSSDDGLSYSRDVRLDSGDGPGAFNSFAPAMATEDGTVVVVWHDERNGEGRDIFMNWSDDHGVTWLAEAVRVDSDNVGFFDSLYPAVLVQGGVAHIVWEDARRQGYDIYYRAAVSAAFDAEEVRLDRDSAGFGNSLNPVIASGEAGLVVAWEDRRYDDGSGYNDLFYNWSEDDGLTWDDIDLRIDSIEDATKYTSDLNLEVYMGELLSAWTDGRRGNTDVFFHHLKVGEEAEYLVAEE